MDVDLKKLFKNLYDSNGDYNSWVNTTKFNKINLEQSKNSNDDECLRFINHYLTNNNTFVIDTISIIFEGNSFTRKIFDTLTQFTNYKNLIIRYGKVKQRIETETIIKHCETNGIKFDIEVIC